MKGWSVWNLPLTWVGDTGIEPLSSSLKPAPPPTIPVLERIGAALDAHLIAELAPHAA